MMKKVTIIFVGLLLIVLAIKLMNSFSISNTVDQTQKMATKESNEGSVAVIVTPLSLDSFEIALDTHSEELDADLVAVSELVDDQGKSYKPVSWEGTPPGGHHREGVLKFNPVSLKPQSLELKLKNVGGVSERRFKWNL